MNIAYQLPYPPRFGSLLILLLFLASCNNPQAQPQIGQKQIVETPKEINSKAEDVLQGALKYLLQQGGNMGDSVHFRYPQLLQGLYDSTHYATLWSADGSFKPATDSLLNFMDSSRKYGLFPQDYYRQKLEQLVHLLRQDTAKEVRLDASKWAYSDLLLTSAFVQIVKDLKYGRLVADSTVQTDSLFKPAFFRNQLDIFHQYGMDSLAASLAPRNPRYAHLLAALPAYLKKADLRKFALIKDRDSIEWPQLVFRRIREEDTLIRAISADSLSRLDSAGISKVIKRYQKWKKWKVDGRLTHDFVDRLNDNDYERFIRLAITLDKYKIDPPLPQKYIWVNIPAYHMEVRDSDSVVLRSKVIVGKPDTRTPTLISAISNMVTYPQWHIPESIIKKEILPGLKRDPGYTKRKGYSLIDKDGNEINPYTVKWSKYKDFIPYNVVQGSGDDNALGVLKFNFPNKYAVYLHDTNQRYLFGKSKRALSHGCVRVQAWKELANYILRNDSAFVAKDTALITATPIDTLNSWLARKEKRVIPIHEKIPLFVRYITCEARDGRLVFYEDIYSEDRKIREKVFADK
jgi:L,D-transpeptidase YcbB